MRDYTRELEVVRRLLSPGMPPLGIAFGWAQPEAVGIAKIGAAGVSLRSEIHLDDLSMTKKDKKRLVAAAKEAGIYEEFPERIDLSPTLFSVEVFYPFEGMRPYHQALHRLHLLFFNSYGVLDGEMHNWACESPCELSEYYYGEVQATYGTWDLQFSDNKEVVDILLEKVDLSEFSHAYGEEASDPPAYPPASWVREKNAVALLFGEEAARDDPGELVFGVAAAIEAVVETQPEHWEKSLDLMDVQVADLDSFEKIRDRLATRLAKLPELSAFAVSARDATNFDNLRAVMDDLREKAPAMGIWLIAA